MGFKLDFATSLLFCQFGFAQGNFKLKERDFFNLKGCWQGTLTYLDYTTNKPFSMPAEVQFQTWGENSRLPYSISYPKEQQANGTDTLIISDNGKLLNGERVVTKKWFGKDSLVVITEKEGRDGNDNAPATIRHTYTVAKTVFVIKKEVRFKDKQEWISRNEYQFVRGPSCK